MADTSDHHDQEESEVQRKQFEPEQKIAVKETRDTKARGVVTTTLTGPRWSTPARALQKPCEERKTRSQGTILSNITGELTHQKASWYRSTDGSFGDFKPYKVSVVMIDNGFEMVAALDDWNTHSPILTIQSRMSSVPPHAVSVSPRTRLVRALNFGATMTWISHLQRAWRAWESRRRTRQVFTGSL